MSFGGALPTVGAQVVIQGLAQFSTAQRQVQQGLQNMGKASEDLGRASAGGWQLAATAAKMGSAAIVAATAAVVAGLIDMGAQYEKALRPAIVFGKASSDQAKVLSRDILELTRTYTTGAKEIAESAGDLTRAGLPYDQLHDKALEATQAMVAVSNAELDAGRAAELVAQATTSYAKQQLSAADAANVMIGAVMASTGNWQDLYLSFKQIMPLAAQLNIPFKDLGATMAVMWQEGIRGETAGTSVRNAFLKMINPTKEVIQVMTMYDLKLFDVKGKFIGMRPFVEELNKNFGEQAVATGKVTDAQAAMALGSLGLSRSMLALLVMAKSGTEGFDAMSKKIEETDYKKLNEELTANLLDQLAILINQIKAFSITFTQGIIKTLGDGTKAVNQFLRAFSLESVEKFSQSLGGVFGQIGQLKDAFLNTAAVQNVFKSLGSTFVALVTIARNLGEILSAIWNHPGLRKYLGAFLDGFNKLLGVTSALGDNLLDKILTAVIAVSEAIKTGVVEGLNAIPFDAIAERVTGAFDQVTNFFQKDVVDLFNYWGQVAANFWNSLPEMAQKGVDNLIPFINSIIEGITSAVQAAYDAAVQFGVGVVNTLAQTVTNTFGGIIGAVGDVANGIFEISSKVAGDLGTIFQSAWKAIAEGAQPLLELFNEAFPGAVNAVVTAAKAVIVVGIVAGKLFESQSKNQIAGTQTLVNVVSGLWKGFITEFTKRWNAIGTFLAGVWNGYIGIVTTFFDFLGKGLAASAKYWADYWRGIAKNAEIAITWIVGRLTAFLDWLEKQPFIGEKVKEFRQAFRDAAQGVDEFFQQVGAMPGQVIEGVRATFDSISGTVDDIVSGIGDQLNTAFGSIGINIGKIFEDAQKAVAGMLPNVGGAVKTVQDFIGRMMEAARVSIGKTKVDVDNLIRGIKEAAAASGQVSAPGKVGPTSGINPDDLTPKADPTTQRAEWMKFVKGMLQGIPMMTDEMAKFVGELTEVEPGRLQPIVGFFRSQAGALREMGESLEKQIRLELQIAEVEKQLAAISRQREAIETAREVALLPFVTKEHQLAKDKVALDMQALPIEQGIAAIDRQMAEAQRENLDLARERLLIQQDMLPLQAQLAEIDKQIAKANQENFAVQRQLLQVVAQEAPIQQQIEDVERKRQAAHRENFAQLRELNNLQRQQLPLNEQLYQLDKQIAAIQREDLAAERAKLNTQLSMLPIQERIDAVDKRIALAQKTNYNLVIAEAKANQAILPLRQQMERIDKQISDAHKDDFDRDERRLRTQLAMVDGQNRLHEIEQRISAAQRTNYEVQKQQAQLDLEALDARTAIADIEQKISNIVDERQQLQMRRDELIAQHAVDLKQRELDRVTKQLDDLWEQFNFRSAAGLGGLAGSLVPGIVDLERQKRELEDMLKGLTNNLDNIHEQQEDINYQNELDTIALQLEEQAHKAILKPIEDRINLLERQQLIEKTRSAAALAQLEAERQAIIDQLQPYQDVLDAIDRQKELTDLNTEITVIGLQRQKANLQRLIQPYQDVIDQINTTKQVTQTEQDLTIAGLQLERELLLGQLQPYQDILDALDSQSQKTDLQNQLAINALQQQKQRTEDLLAPMLEQQHRIEQIQQAQQLQFEAADINYREELQRLNDLLAPLENQRLAIERVISAEQRNRDLTLNFLGQQRQDINNLLQPYQDQIDKIERTTTAEQIQRDLVINYLENQKRKLEDLLKPINDARIAIENETAALALHKTQIDLTYQLQLDKLRDLELPLIQYKQRLDEAKTTEQQRFNFMLQAFQDAINKSGLFTQTEATEIPKRLNLWGQEVDKVTTLKDRLNDVITALGGTGNAFVPLPGQAQPMIDKFITAKDKSNDLKDAFNNLVGAIGNSGSGIYQAVNNFNTPLGNLQTAMGNTNTSATNLRTALNDITGGNIGLNIDTLKNKFSGGVGSLENYVNNAKTSITNLRDALSGGSTYDLYDAMLDVGNQTDWLRLRFAVSDYSLGKHADYARGNIEKLRDSLYTPSISDNHLYRAIGQVGESVEDFRWQFWGRDYSMSVHVYQCQQTVDNLRRALGTSTYDNPSLLGSVDRNRQAFNDWATAISNAAYQLRTFPTGQVNVTKNFAEGGVVPGPVGAPTLAVVHGGERVIPVSAGTGPYEPSRASAASRTINNNTVIYNTNYNMSANYERYQDPITVDQNLRTLVTLSRR